MNRNLIGRRIGIAQSAGIHRGIFHYTRPCGDGRVWGRAPRPSNRAKPRHHDPLTLHNRLQSAAAPRETLAPATSR